MYQEEELSSRRGFKSAFKRPCRRCNKQFLPQGRYSRLCKDCHRAAFGGTNRPLIDRYPEITGTPEPLNKQTSHN